MYYVCNYIILLIMQCNENIYIIYNNLSPHYRYLSIFLKRYIYTYIVIKKSFNLEQLLLLIYYLFICLFIIIFCIFFIRFVYCKWIVKNLNKKKEILFYRYKKFNY